MEVACRYMHASACVYAHQPWAGRIGEALPDPDRNRDRDFKSSPNPTLFRVGEPSFPRKVGEASSIFRDGSRRIGTGQGESRNQVKSGLSRLCPNISALPDLFFAHGAPDFPDLSLDCRGVSGSRYNHFLYYSTLPENATKSPTFHNFERKMI